jgi:hypothetical protein
MCCSGLLRQVCFSKVVGELRERGGGGHQTTKTTGHEVTATCLFEASAASSGWFAAPARRQAPGTGPEAVIPSLESNWRGVLALASVFGLQDSALVQ